MQQPRKKVAGVAERARVCARGGYAAARTLALAVVLVPFVLPGWAAGEQRPSKRKASRPSPIVALGTWHGLDIALDLIQHYGRAGKARSVHFTPLDSHQIPGYLSRHQCDIGMTLDSQLSKESLTEIGRCQNSTLGRFVVGVAVNAKNPVRRITADDLRSVFFGATTSWKDVSSSGSSQQIKVYRPLRDSSVGTILRTKVLLKSPSGETLLEPPGARGHEEKPSAEIIGAVIDQASAIGFVLHHYGESADTRLRILPLAPDKNTDAVPPSSEAVADGTYPLTDALTLHLHPNAPPAARDFCELRAKPRMVRCPRDTH